MIDGSIVATFADPWNPSSSEIQAWAFEVDAEHPCQDWELALLWRGYEDLYLELAADAHCPSAGFFLSILYLMVGDQIRRGAGHQVKFNLNDLVAKANIYDNCALRVWQARSRRLVKHPEEFDYELWCGGGYAAEG